MPISFSSSQVHAGAGLGRPAARALSTDAQHALQAASTLGAVNPAMLAQHLAGVGDTHLRQQVLDELESHLSPRDLDELHQHLDAPGGALGRAAQRPPVADAGDLALDLTQIGLDVAGLVDPTPISDGVNALISLGRGDWTGAALSAVSMVPYVGDAAKVGKLGSYAQTVAKAVDAARTNPALRETLAPAIQKISAALNRLPLDKLPDGVRAQLVTLKELTGIFGREAAAVAPPARQTADALPARSGQAPSSSAADAAHATAAASRVGAQPAWGRYMDDIRAQTGLAVHPKQKRLLDAHLAKHEHTRLSPADSKAHRAAFNKVKNNLIAQWEKQTGQTWPRYTENLYSKSGVLVRKAGQPYDAHHIIESSYGGPNKWWNMHPARFPDQHQQGIHRAGGPASQIFI